MSREDAGLQTLHAAFRHVAAGEWDQATRLLAHLPCSGPVSLQADHIRALIDLQRGALDRAHAAFQRLMPHLQQDPNFVVNFATCCHRRDDLQAARRLYLQALEMIGPNEDILVKAARCLIRLSRFGEARDLLDRAPAASAGFDIMLLRADIAHRLDGWEAARPAFQAALAASDGDAGRLNLVGHALYEKAHYPEARQVFNAVLARDPRHVPALVGFVQVPVGSSSWLTTWTLPAAFATSSGCTLSASVILMRRRSS